MIQPWPQRPLSSRPWKVASQPPAPGQQELTESTDLAVRTALRDAIGKGIELDRVVFILTRCAAETGAPLPILYGHCMAAVQLHVQRERAK